MNSVEDAPPSSSKWRASLWLFAILFGIYLANGDFLRGDVATFSSYLPSALLNRGKLSTTPTEMPWMFIWELRTESGPRLIPVRRWTDRIGDSTLFELKDRGDLVFLRHVESQTPTVRHDEKTGEVVFVNTFGVGAGLSALPVFAVLHVIFGDLENHPRLIWYGAKVVASMLVAGSAVFVFLAVLRFTTRRPALLIALAYGLGTCVWSLSSQTLWQHGPNEFFLAAGAYFLVHVDRGRLHAAACGLAFSAAVACRPTSLVVAVTVGAYILITNRKAALPFLLGALPIGVALGWYNAYYFGSPLSPGRDYIDRLVAVEKTGSADLWQTPLWTGAAGLLFSPSRGLLVYSPFVIFAIPAFLRVWRDRRFHALRPLTLATLALVLLASKWFDWWGGWTFGYRPIVDTMPFVAICLVAGIERIVAHRTAFLAFCVLLSWSVLVQFVGAFAYDLDVWNGPVLRYEVVAPGRSAPLEIADREDARRIARLNPGSLVRMVIANIDLPEYRYRLWSVRDSQLVYLFENFRAMRYRKKANNLEWVRTR